MGYWEVVPLRDVKNNPHFTNTKNLKGNSDNLKNFMDPTLNPGEVPNDLKRVKLYHYFERARQIHVVMCDETPNPLYAEKWTHKTGRYPFRYLLGPGDEDTPYGMPMPLLLQHAQKE